jgi:hypothetical protein
LEQAKARDLLMANMQAEYQTKLRRDALNGELIDEDPTIDTGGSVALNDPNVIDPASLIPPVRTVGDKNGSGGEEGAAAPAGGAAGGNQGGGAPAWAFGGANGDGNQGGNALPAQPKGAKYAGSAAGAANTKGFGGGFGTLADKGETPAEGAAGAPTIQEIGDGGLRVMLARTSIIHARHAPQLVKSIDFKKLAQAAPQGKVPERAPATSSTPMTRN